MFHKVTHLLRIKWSLQRNADGVAEVCNAEDYQSTDLPLGEGPQRQHCHNIWRHTKDTKYQMCFLGYMTAWLTATSSLTLALSLSLITGCTLPSGRPSSTRRMSSKWRDHVFHEPDLLDRLPSHDCALRTIHVGVKWANLIFEPVVSIR